MSWRRPNVDWRLKWKRWQFRWRNLRMNYRLQRMLNSIWKLICRPSKSNFKETCRAERSKVKRRGNNCSSRWRWIKTKKSLLLDAYVDLSESELHGISCRLLTLLKSAIAIILLYLPTWYTGTWAWDWARRWAEDENFTGSCQEKTWGGFAGPWRPSWCHQQSEGWGH